MISIHDFKQALSFHDLINIGEKIDPYKPAPKDYYKEVLYQFEEPAFCIIQNKVKLMQIAFDDNDVVTYIYRYSSIFSVKTYTLTNIPFSANHNKLHIKEIISHLILVIPDNFSILVTDSEINECSKLNKAVGYENYCFNYENILQKILLDKRLKKHYNKYVKTMKFEYYSSSTEEIQNRILNIWKEWYKTAPNPNKGTDKNIINILKYPTLDIFIFKINNKDVSFSIGIHTDIYASGIYGYTLSRSGYNSLSIFTELFISKYLKEHFNIDRYYIYGYEKGNSGLKRYKEHWSVNKITTYRLYTSNIDIIMDLIDKE